MFAFVKAAYNILFEKKLQLIEQISLTNIHNTALFHI